MARTVVLLATACTCLALLFGQSLAVSPPVALTSIAERRASTLSRVVESAARRVRTAHQRRVQAQEHAANALDTELVSDHQRSAALGADAQRSEGEAARRTGVRETYRLWVRTGSGPFAPLLGEYSAFTGSKESGEYDFGGSYVVKALLTGQRSAALHGLPIAPGLYAFAQVGGNVYLSKMKVAIPAGKAWAQMDAVISQADALAVPARVPLVMSATVDCLLALPAPPLMSVPGGAKDPVQHEWLSVRPVGRLAPLNREWVMTAFTRPHKADADYAVPSPSKVSRAKAAPAPARPAPRSAVQPRTVEFALGVSADERTRPGAYALAPYISWIVDGAAVRGNGLYPGGQLSLDQVLAPGYERVYAVAHRHGRRIATLDDDARVGDSSGVMHQTVLSLWKYGVPFYLPKLGMLPWTWLDHSSGERKEAPKMQRNGRPAVSTVTRALRTGTIDAQVLRHLAVLQRLSRAPLTGAAAGGGDATGVAADRERKEGDAAADGASLQLVVRLEAAVEKARRAAAASKSVAADAHAQSIERLTRALEFVRAAVTLRVKSLSDLLSRATNADFRAAMTRVLLAPGAYDTGFLALYNSVLTSWPSLPDADKHPGASAIDADAQSAVAWADKQATTGYRQLDVSREQLASLLSVAKVPTWNDPWKFKSKK